MTKNVVLRVRVSRQMYEHIKGISEYVGVSQSEVTRLLIILGLRLLDIEVIKLCLENMRELKTS